MVPRRLQLNDEQKHKHLLWEQRESELRNGKIESAWYLMRRRFEFRSKMGQEEKKLKELVNRIIVAVQSANVRKGTEYLLSFFVHSENLRTNSHVIVNCHGLLERRSTTMVLRLEVKKYIRPQ